MDVENNKELCDEAFRVQTNVLFLSTQSVVIILDITGLFLAIYVSAIILLYKIFHINLRMLITSLLVLLILRSTFTLYRSFGYVYRAITTNTDHCSLLEESRKCQILSLLAAAPNKCLPYAFTAIVLERTVATFLYNRYEKWQYPIALIFIPPSWFEIALSILRVLSLRINDKNQKNYMSYCSSINNKTVDYTGIITIDVPIIITCFVLFCVIHFISKRKMKLNLASSVDPLSSRYQIMENLKTSKTMLIASSMYTFCIIFSFIGIILLAHFGLSDLKWFAIFKEITSFAVPIFINSFSLLFILKVHAIRIRTTRWMPCISQTFDEEPSKRYDQGLTSQQHMEVLRNIWTSQN